MLKKLTARKIFVSFLALTFFAGIMSGCANTKKESSTRIIEDMAGRKVTVKSDINKIYAAMPIGTVLVYTINPDKLISRNFELSEAEKKYTVKEYQDLPVMGNLIVGNTANVEELLKINPDIILYAGTINDTWKGAVDKTQEKLNIPIVMVDGSLENTAEAYDFMGDLLGEQKRTKVLSEYCQNAIDQAKQTAAKISDDKKAGVYYAVGNLLTTYPNGTIHSELIDLVGGDNVAKTNFTNGYARAQVSAEQLLKWDPDVFIVNKANARVGEGNDLRSMLLSESMYANLNAVKEQKIYEIPYLPFSWFGEPPGVNRILGIKWLGNLLYPSEFNYDIKEEVKEFYKAFYYIDLTDEELTEIMSNAVMK